MKTTFQERFWKRTKTNQVTGCMEWTGFILPSGYGDVYFEGRTTRAHRVSFFISNGYLTPGLDVAHKCHNRKCVNPEHLRELSRKENILESVVAGRCPQLDPGNGRKITPEIARKIRSHKHSYGVNSELGRKFGVSAMMVHKIRANKSWKSI